MKITKQNPKLAASGLMAVLITAAALLLSGAPPACAGQDNGAKVVQPGEHYRGQTYAEWSASWWQWNLGLPLAGHPSTDSADFDVREGQHGAVWFLAGPPETHERSITVPAGKALFIAVINAECSSLEPPDSGFHGDTEAEQRDCAKYWSDHIVNRFCTIDNEEIANIGDFRVVSPQFEFEAPTPWIYGATGGQGTSVGDGYYVMLRPLGKGVHTIRYGGVFHFTLAQDGFDGDSQFDTTYHVTVR